jgi:hypothetical protein
MGSWNNSISSKRIKLRSQMIIMKKIFLFALLLPAFAFAQNKLKPKAKLASKAATPAKITDIKPADGFIINALIKGFPDGTPVSLLNGQTGAPEAETTINKNAFTFKGKVVTPDFKVILLK